MLATVYSCTLIGLTGYLVRVEVDVAAGLPAFDLVGLPDASVREAKERVRAAIRNSGFEFPVKRITVNLAPANIRKEGPQYDLPIAIGILAATEQIPAAQLNQIVLAGELSLDGSVRSINGVLAMAAVLHQEREKNCFLVPAANAPEGAMVTGLKVLGIEHLTQLVAYLRKDLAILPTTVDIAAIMRKETEPNSPDMLEVKGQETVKRSLEIAAAGGHNILLIGAPGTGKTMLAQRLLSILPPMSLTECLEITKIYSVAGLLPPGKPLITTRPFRSPHHTASAASLIGGGRVPRPGEISLATHGILFLDEFPEYDREVLEALRQPLEDRVVTISRVAAALTYPARFLLICSMNPCPCGFLNDPVRECVCTPRQIMRYQTKISGPLLDRIDLHVEVPRLQYHELEESRPTMSSAEMKVRVTKAREIQLDRMAAEGVICNAQMQAAQIRRYCTLDKEARQLLRQAFTQLGLSMRSHDKIIKVARTIADLDGGGAKIMEHHVAEVLQYRLGGHGVGP